VVLYGVAVEYYSTSHRGTRCCNKKSQHCETLLAFFLSTILKNQLTYIQTLKKMSMKKLQCTYRKAKAKAKAKAKKKKKKKKENPKYLIYIHSRNR
jgi:hypothetical protein